jgi:hypothetical protein
MLKCSLPRVTTNHGNLTHLIFVRPHSVVVNYIEGIMQTLCRKLGRVAGGRFCPCGIPIGVKSTGPTSD